MACDKVANTFAVKAAAHCSASCPVNCWGNVMLKLAFNFAVDRSRDCANSIALDAAAKFGEDSAAEFVPLILIYVALDVGLGFAANLGAKFGNKFAANFAAKIGAELAAKFGANFGARLWI